MYLLEESRGKFWHARKRLIIPGCAGAFDQKTQLIGVINAGFTQGHFVGALERIGRKTFILILGF